MLQISSRRPEPWVAVALYSEMKGEKDKALGFVDKVTQHIPRNSGGV
jgi:hypothetical protein